MKFIRVAFSIFWLSFQIGFPSVQVMAQEGSLSEQEFLSEIQGSNKQKNDGPIIERAGGNDPAENKADGSSDPDIPQATTPGTPMENAEPASPSKAAPRAKGTPLYETAENVSPLDSVVTVRMGKGGTLSSFLDAISAQTKINFIIEPELANMSVSAVLPRVTVREALQVLLQMKGLTYQRIGRNNIFAISKRSLNAPNLITKIYTLNYVSFTSGDDGGGQQGTADLSSGGKGSDSGIGIVNVIKGVLSRGTSSSPGSGGSVQVEPRTNSLIVTDIAETFPQIETIINELDRKAPQVLIEAQIVEINSDRVNELGIEWGGANGELASFTGPSRLTDYGLRPGFFSGDSWKYFFPKGAASGTNDGITSGVFSLAQLQAILKALIKSSSAKYIGRPKITTLNNKTATIEVYQDAAVGTSNVVASAGGSVGTSTTAVERKKVGLTLKVTPQVNKEGYITLAVQPSYSDVKASALGNTVWDPVSRSANTMVRVKNGQTVVLGGLISANDTKVVRKVPLLGYIPIIGWLFTSVSSRRMNTDLVLFITPTILVD